MAELTIVKREPTALSDQDNATLRRFLMESMGGLSPDDEKRWRKFWNRLKGAEPGEVFSVSLTFPRDPVKHRKFFALLNVGFEHWQAKRKHKTYRGVPVEKNFDTFRKDVTILAGYYEQHFDLQGRMKLEAQSISFANMEDDEFERLYDAVAQVLLEQVLTTYAGRAELDEIVDRIMKFTNHAV